MTKMATKATIISHVKSITASMVDQGYINSPPLDRLKNFPSSIVLVDDDNDFALAIRLWAKTIHEQVLMRLPYQILLDIAKNDEKLKWINDLISLLQE